MSFLSGWFLAGMVAVAAPTLIHLLNRTRRRTIYWAAMDFLRDAIRRNRRVLQLRDILLLALRTLTVFLFVLAMARPFWSAGDDKSVGDQPIHAVLVVDNSLSMAYAELDKSLLSIAKEKASTFIEALPEGSEISVIPLCNYSQWHARDVYSTREDALEAVARIEIVDRSAPIVTGFAQAQRACRLASDIPTKRVVFLGDLQRNSWSLSGVETYLDGIEDVQVVQVSPAKRTNTWVESFKLLHGIADTQSTAVFRAVIRHEGEARKDSVRVTLKIHDVVVAEQYVDLLPGSNPQLDFRHKFDVAGTSAEPLFVPATLELSPDRLPDDDRRTLIVPVVATVPVVFVDQYGASERPEENLFGETARIRRLMSAPGKAREAEGAAAVREKRLVKVVHRTIEEIKQDDLKEARLVVVGGVKSPTPEAVDLLRQYVEQGGQLFLSAGAEFDPAAWTSIAWREGAGILPAPLSIEPVGKVPQPHETTMTSFRLKKDSMVGEVFHLDTTQEETDDIYESPMIFKAVVADVAAARQAISETERKRIEQRRDWLAKYRENEKQWTERERTGGKLSPQDADRRERDQLTYAAMSPRWLAWTNPLAQDTEDLTVEQLVDATQPRVLGRYDNDYPFALHRDIGKGRVVMLTTGLWPKWNTLAIENSVLLLDRIVRSLMVRSLPDRTFGPESQILIPVDAADQAVDFTLKAPGDDQPRLKSVEALGKRGYGLLLRDIQRRGLYSVHRQSPAGEGDQAGGAPADIVLAVNGPAEESELASWAQEDLPDKIGKVNIRWLGVADKIQLTGKTYIDPDFWQYLMAAALLCLLVEMSFLAWWWWARRSAA